LDIFGDFLKKTSEIWEIISNFVADSCCLLSSCQRWTCPAKHIAQTAYAWLKEVKPLKEELTEAGYLEGIV